MQEKSSYLRSINLVYDAENPERVGHFQPTAKCVGLMKNLAGLNADRAFFVTAPYGSGKSLSATYLLHLVQNRPESKEILSKVQKRFESVSPEMLQFSKKRLGNKAIGGIFIALEGYHDDVGLALQQAALKALARVKMGRQARFVSAIDATGSDGAILVLKAICDKAIKSKKDRVVVVWDEFGRHLERLVASGQSAKINDIQRIAEFVAREERIPVTFSAIMHQGMLNYAGSTSQSGIAEWRKVEGRFRTIQYVDDSREIYQLIANLVQENRAELTATEKKDKIAITSLRQSEIFTGFSAIELEEMLSNAWPLDPFTLFMLPRLAARAAQNERTLFGFIFQVSLESPVKLQDLFDYFEPAMRNDTGVGGTYRAWLETQSAISKAKTELEVAALKSLCLLTLGMSGERIKTNRQLLELALAGAANRKEIKKSVDDLVKRKLLLTRKHTGEVAIWHGTDVDLRGRLTEEKAKVGEGFDVEEFLDREFPPPVWRPTSYNDRFAVRRYLRSKYLDHKQLRSYLDQQTISGVDPGVDGEVIYVRCEKEADLHAAQDHIETASDLRQVVFVLPKEPVSLREAVIEVVSLEKMKLDDKLLERDPLVANELQQMLDDSRAHASRLLEQLISPESKNLDWYYCSRKLNIQSKSDFRRVLSDIMESVFERTPRLNNEMIVRHKPSPTIVNSRKKLVLGIIERYGQERFGLEGEFADASMFRTILLNTGLYIQDATKRWRFAHPPEIEDKILAQVWELFRDFFTVPSKSPKDLGRFLDRLLQPPYGLRRGVLPIFLSAAMKAFPSALSIVRQNGEYLADILPSDIEDMCKNPLSYRISVLPIGTDETKYLGRLKEIFGEQRDGQIEDDLIRDCYDAVELWKHTSAPGAFTSRLVSVQAQKLQMALQSNQSPTDLFFVGFPRIAGTKELASVADVIATLAEELSDVVDLYRTRIDKTVRVVFGSGIVDETVSIRQLASDWAVCFPKSFVGQVIDPNARALLVQLKNSYVDDVTFIDMLATMVAGKAPGRWDDQVVIDFEQRVQLLINSIENQALQSAKGEFDESGFAKIIQRKIGALVKRLEQYTTKEEAHRLARASFEDYDPKKELTVGKHKASNS